ncbi:MAG TPA: hypothetical protein VFQ25_07665 [Ktedonobacterales bacterium]|nr:hypothetical protein [Ktedonobacterales bacterium]
MQWMSPIARTCSGAIAAPQQLDSLDALLDVPTIALFEERASAAAPSFALAMLEDARLAGSRSDWP